MYKKCWINLFKNKKSEVWGFIIKKMEFVDMLVRMIFVFLMFINGFEFINVDGDSFGCLENIVFDL